MVSNCSVKVEKFWAFGVELRKAICHFFMTVKSSIT